MTQSSLYGDLACCHTHAAVRWKLCPLLSNCKLLRECGKTKHRRYFSPIAHNMRLAFGSRTSALWGRRETDAICETQVFAALLPSHVHSTWLITTHLYRMIENAGSTANSWFTLTLSHWSIGLIRQRIVRRSNLWMAFSFLHHWRSGGILFRDLLR